MNSVRLDVFLVEKGLEKTRERAKSLVQKGSVFVNGEQVTKPAFSVSDDAGVEIRGEGLKYVSRGGLKLEKALAHFDINASRKTALDIGASTGGFTDCLLQNGAKKVIAIDVGTSQLDPSLIDDTRVVSLENTNFKDIDTSKLEKVDLIVCDVSFISISLILPNARRLIKDGGSMVALIKPQFEVGSRYIGKNGVVKDEKAHVLAINSVLDYVKQKDFTVIDITYSPIKGPKGNIEFLMHLQVNGRDNIFDVKALVRDAHKNLG